MPADAFRVLLVDDDHSMLISMEAILSETFYVRMTHSANEALRILDRDYFHVVCADWRMPDMDGIELFRALSRKTLNYVPCCVLISAHAAEVLTQVSVEDRKTLGILRKPFSPQELIERVTLFANLAHLKSSSTKLKAAIRKDA
jgi:two-component system C4-dicarboxylate transport response regulator DctD